MTYKILETEEIGTGVFKMVIEAPDAAKAAKAGQFVMVRTGETGERIPLTIADFDKERGTVTIVAQALGKSTKILTSLKAYS